MTVDELDAFARNMDDMRAECEQKIRLGIEHIAQTSGVSFEEAERRVRHRAMHDINDLLCEISEHLGDVVGPAVILKVDAQIKTIYTACRELHIELTRMHEFEYEDQQPAGYAGSRGVH